MHLLLLNVKKHWQTIKRRMTGLNFCLLTKSLILLPSIMFIDLGLVLILLSGFLRRRQEELLYRCRWLIPNLAFGMSRLGMRQRISTCRFLKHAKTKNVILVVEQGMRNVKSVMAKGYKSVGNVMGRRKRSVVSVKVEELFRVPAALGLERLNANRAMGRVEELTFVLFAIVEKLSEHVL